ncbi:MULTISPECIES: fimbria/pilus periplasmic chaperone [Burkholderia]
MRLWKMSVAAATMACCLASTLSHAAIVITGTRVVYPESSREVNVRLTNVEQSPVLVQAWIDDGNAGASPNEIKVPFVLMPPVFRVEPKKGQTLRVMYTGDDLPKDRESVYWLNVLEIPPKPTEAADQNLLQLAFRTRIKLFFRPSALEDGNAAQAREQLTWKVVRNDKGVSVLRAENRSPYYISISQATVKSGDRSVRLDPGMVAPFGSREFVSKQDISRLSAHAEISYKLLNDYGAEVAGTATAE